MRKSASTNGFHPCENRAQYLHSVLHGWTNTRRTRKRYSLTIPTMCTSQNSWTHGMYVQILITDHGISLRNMHKRPQIPHLPMAMYSRKVRLQCSQVPIPTKDLACLSKLNAQKTCLLRVPMSQATLRQSIIFLLSYKITHTPLPPSMLTPLSWQTVSGLIKRK